MKEIILKVEGMACEGCEKRIQNAVSSIEGVESVVANHKAGTVIVKADENVAEETIKEKIDNIGFEVVS